VVPVSFHDFFGGCASVAGALIGLLFVALSVSPEKLTGDDVRAEHQVRAGAAFSALVNTLVIALVALLPAGLPLLLGGADQHLVDRDVPRPGNDIGDRVGDVLGFHPLPELVSQALEHLGPVVAGQLRRGRARLDQ
jgi:hypothetical protein